MKIYHEHTEIVKRCLRPLFGNNHQVYSVYLTYSSWVTVFFVSTCSHKSFSMFLKQQYSANHDIFALKTVKYKQEIPRSYIEYISPMVGE
jgi:hypothetical protein